MTEPTFAIKPLSEKPGFGRFSIEPLINGYGQTLGNSLRRVLLTSLQGSAITSVRITGVHHQFTTIPGLKEDVVEFLLNLKKVRLTIADDGLVKLTLSKKGAGEILAGDIETPAGVAIVNPDLVLGMLADKNSQIEMEINAQTGYGYVPVEDKDVEELGLIPMDALYSPIERVNYKVEATRVGRMTNLDRLVMEIWTDGTVTPLEAIKEAARILITYYQQIVDPKEQTESHTATQVPVSNDEVLKIRVEELDIPTRIVNALMKAGYDTVGKLVIAPRADLMKVKNLGAKSLKIVEERLAEKNVTIGSGEEG